MSRLLAIGFPLPNVAIDNYTVFSAPSYFDYDWLFVDPAGITSAAHELVEGSRTFEAFDGRPVVNGATTAVAVSAADQVRRRSEETQRLLDAGGVVVVLARPNAIAGGLVGFEGCDRYSWLPAPAGLSWGPPFLRAAEGKTLRIADEDHPVSGLLRDFRAEFSYRAVFDERHPAFRDAGRVIARGGAGAAIAVDLRVLSGRVLFLPVIGESYGSTRSDIAERLVEVCRALSGVGLPGQRPAWAEGVELPGIAPLSERLGEARRRLEAAQQELAEAEETFAGLDHYRSLLWETGPVLAAEVREAFRLLGFEVTGDPGEPFAISSGEASAAVEVEGSREQVVEWPYVRLQRRLEEILLRTGTAPGGVVVVNGERMKEPSVRGQQYTDALRNACENYRYCLLTTETLFAMVRRALAGADEAELLGYRRRILATHGLLVLNEPEPAPGAPLF